MSLDLDIHDNHDAHRYELTIDGQTAVVMYNEVGGGLLITETIVPVPLEGRGVASRLAKHVLADIRARGILILPTCPFFAGYLQKHPEHADIVHPSYRIALGL
ncbi:GNAT family N-acetyltransferase [Brevundimonas sp.]|jgi:predicted GNAT family acetyltransferase|uniref:GNAT family N-acetyltransferase n=1 Tax=Brevundimonas sp. TaxID=1871086 RepID=UPI0037C0570F